MSSQLFRKDGYINATHLCTSGGKLFGHWKSLQSTTKQIYDISKELNIPIDKLIEIKKGGNIKIVTQGTWIHPRLATLLAQWISPSFNLQVSKWIEDWTQSNLKNEEEYKESLSSITPETDKIYKEAKLASLYSGKTEIVTKFGKIDVLTDNMIIEIKIFKHWKHALGQILAYSEEYKNHTKVICLFDVNTLDNLEDIKTIYSKYNIELIIE